MNHNWKEHVFDACGTFEGVSTCTQIWICPRCEKQILLPYGIKPCVPGECIDTRAEREAHEEKMRQIREKLPTGWGNGKKARRR